MDKNGPFQTYDDRSDAATCEPRLGALSYRLEIFAVLSEGIAGKGGAARAAVHFDAHRFPRVGAGLAGVTQYCHLREDFVVKFGHQKDFAVGITAPVLAQLKALYRHYKRVGQLPLPRTLPKSSAGRDWCIGLLCFCGRLVVNKALSGGM